MCRSCWFSNIETAFTFSSARLGTFVCRSKEGRFVHSRLCLSFHNTAAVNVHGWRNWLLQGISELFTMVDQKSNGHGSILWFMLDGLWAVMAEGFWLVSIRWIFNGRCLINICQVYTYWSLRPFCHLISPISLVARPMYAHSCFFFGWMTWSGSCQPKHQSTYRFGGLFPCPVDQFQICRCREPSRSVECTSLISDRFIEVMHYFAYTKSTPPLFTPLHLRMVGMVIETLTMYMVQ